MTASHAPGKATLDERSNHCFVCGPDNPKGLHLDFSIDTTDPSAPISTAHIQFDHHYQGPPGYLHGGLIATLLDEAMSKLNRPLHALAMTRNMQIDYLRPVPLDKPIIVTGRHVRREGRKLYNEAQIALPNGTILAEAKGLFIVIEEKLFTEPQGNTQST